MLKIIRNTITDFCLEFVKNPYLSYTEHGQHALFYSMLYAALPEQERHLRWENKKVCVLQKEYPTAGKLEKPKRQHWDITVLKSPLESAVTGKGAYDYLKIFAVIEFGMNEAMEHLKDDMERLCHDDANLEHRFIVHLYRLSESGALFSGRDWSPNSPRIVKLESIQKLSANNPVEIFYGLSDSTNTRESGVWLIKDGDVIKYEINYESSKQKSRPLFQAES